MSTVLSPGFISAERTAVIAESITGLLDVQKRRQLSQVERIALKSLVSLHSLAISHRNAVVSHADMRDHVAVAQAAMESA